MFGFCARSGEPLEKNMEDKIMKKTICIFMCLVMALSICSCSKSGTVVALEVGGVYDADDGGNHASDYDVWYSEDRLSFEDLTSASTYTIEIDGTEYSGEYSYSGVGVYNNYQSDYYTIVSDICSCLLYTSPSPRDRG